MRDTGDTTDCRQLREFADVDLSRSYVLSWHMQAGALHVDVDVFLTPEHPFYVKPRPAEKFCIRPAAIEFPACEEIDSGESAGGEVVDIIDNIGHGAINDLRRLGDGRYEISGDFGTVLINADRPILRLKEH